MPGDSIDSEDVFVFDRQNQTTARVSVAADGTQANGGSSRPKISGDGRYVTYGSYASNLVPEDTNLREDVFVSDRQTMTTARVSVTADGTQANDGSSTPAISGDGRYIAHFSHASNLVVGDTNNFADVFVARMW